MSKKAKADKNCQTIWKTKEEKRMEGQHKPTKIAFAFKTFGLLNIFGNNNTFLCSIGFKDIVLSFRPPLQNGQSHTDTSLDNIRLHLWTPT